MAGRRGLVVPQNIFLENIIKRANGAHQHFLLASAELLDSPIVYCSDGFIKMTGYKKNQVMKKKANCSFMYGSLTTKDDVRVLRSVIQEKKDAQIEILFYKRDGTPFWVLLNIGLVRNELDEIVLFMLTFQDISEFKEPINPNYRKHRWTEFNKNLHAKPVADNPISKAKEEKNRIQIAELMVNSVDGLPEYKQDIPKTPRFVILHCSTKKIIWDWLILIFILYTATSVPFIVCFKFDNEIMTIADAVVDIMFLFDIAFNFHTSYVDEDGTIVFDLKLIRRTYFRSWFFVDLVTSLPYGLLVFVTTGSQRNITDMISFLKAVRLLRLNRVVRALDQYLEYGFITLILWMLFFCLCSHWMACIFYAIADHYDKFADIGWVRSLSEMTQQPLIVINGTVKEGPTLASLYMSSLYFSLTSLTSIGFGNIAPNTTAEKIFSCVTMIFGGLCYAVIFGQVTAIVQQSQKKSESYHRTLENMRSFCKLYKVPKEVSTRIIDYYMYTWTLNKGVDTNEVLQHCPKDLQSDICIHLNRKVIDGTPAFGELSNAVLRAIARNFAIHRVAPGERVVHEGESLDTLYFVATGSFEVTQKGKVVGLVGEGDVFGDDIFRNSEIGRSVADVFALTYGNVHVIGRDELLGALSFYPEYGYQFAKVFRLSYNLRDEIIMKRFSAHPRRKSNAMSKEMDASDFRRTRSYSFVEEMQNTLDTDSNSFDLTTPNSQSMTDTDPPSKSLAFVKGSKPVLLSHGMKAISEDGEFDDTGDDEDWKRWHEHQTSKETTEGLFNEITGMKSDVRREIEVMGGKMNQLEQNIATILSLLKERDLPTGGSRRLSTGGFGLPIRPPGSAVSGTATIVNRVKAEMPEETLPSWVENYATAENTNKAEDYISEAEDTSPSNVVVPEKPKKKKRKNKGRGEAKGTKERDKSPYSKETKQTKKKKENAAETSGETPPEFQNEEELQQHVESSIDLNRGAELEKEDPPTPSETNTENSPCQGQGGFLGKEGSEDRDRSPKDASEEALHENAELEKEDHVETAGRFSRQSQLQPEQDDGQPKKKDEHVVTIDLDKTESENKFLNNAGYVSDSEEATGRLSRHTARDLHSDDGQGGSKPEEIEMT